MDYSERTKISDSLVKHLRLKKQERYSKNAIFLPTKSYKRDYLINIKNALRSTLEEEIGVIDRRSIVSSHKKKSQSKRMIKVYNLPCLQTRHLDINVGYKNKISKTDKFTCLIVKKFPKDFDIFSESTVTKPLWIQ